MLILNFVFNSINLSVINIELYHNFFIKKFIVVIDLIFLFNSLFLGLIFKHNGGFYQIHHFFLF